MRAVRLSVRHRNAAALLAFFVLLVVSVARAEPRVGQPAPEVTGLRWVNSEALSMRALHGRVVLVEFWTYG